MLNNIKLFELSCPPRWKTVNLNVHSRKKNDNSSMTYVARVITVHRLAEFSSSFLRLNTPYNDMFNLSTALAVPSLDRQLLHRSRMQKPNLVYVCCWRRDPYFQIGKHSGIITPPPPVVWWYGKWNQATAWRWPGSRAVLYPRELPHFDQKKRL